MVHVVHVILLRHTVDHPIGRMHDELSCWCNMVVRRRKKKVDGAKQ
jgi:hypothetical protein